MQVKIEDVSAVEKKIGVEVPWSYVSQKMEEEYRKLGRGVAIPGFRKGKVPRTMLEKMYAGQVERDVMNKLVQETFVAVAMEHKLEPVAEPVVDDAKLNKGQSFAYSARVEIRTIVEPKDYFAVPLQKRASNVTDAQVEDALKHKQDELTEYKMIEGREPANLNATDVAVIAVKGTIKDQPIDRDGIMVDLGDASREPLPGLAKALLGLPIKTENHDIALDFPDPEFAGEDKSAAPMVSAKLAITVKEAREKQTPTLDDEFAKDTGEADTLAELREKTRAKLLEADDKEAQNDLKRDLIKELLNRNSFLVAGALIDRQIESLIQRTRMQMAMRGVDPRTVPMDLEKMRADFRGTAEEEVRAAFLIDAIADKEKVEVSEAELEKRLAELAAARDKSVPRLKAELQKEGRMESLSYQLREEKTLDLVLSKASIKS